MPLILTASARADADLPSWETESSADAAPEDAPERALDSEVAADPTAPPLSLDVDARLAALDSYIDEIEAPTKRYFGTWVAVQSALVLGQAAVALSADEDATKGSYWIGAGISAASLGLVLFSPRPAVRGASRYRALPAGTDSEKRAKVLEGELLLEKQASADRRATSWASHVLSAGVALGSGAAVALLYEHSLKEAVQRVFLTFVITELQLVTRPDHAIRNQQRYAADKAGVQLAFAPMLDRYTQGVSVGARF